MSSAVSMFSSANMKSPSPISLTDGCQVNLTGQMTEKQVDREQDIQEQKVNCSFGRNEGYSIGSAERDALQDCICELVAGEIVSLCGFELKLCE